ncbi:unnamed protein product [Anisakis simplex]|uniref:LRRNT domain-containing protein n=1 Tax=Anisakis simplex TaxID=6269 RepID=A0A0M3JY12_ANISI|nr:unnamed protein product [Anisakis simplex]
MKDHLFAVVVSVLLCIAAVKSEDSREKESRDDEIFDLPPITCDSKSPCSCDEDDGRVNCDEIIWTTEDEDEPLYTPLRSPNLTVTKKGFKPKIVSFRHNDIARLKKGEILPGSEKTLEELDFSYNRIYKMADSLFETMIKLRILRFSHNHLKQLNRTTFNGTLWNMHQLYLDWNYFTELPDIFEELPNLEKLVLDGNKKLKLSKKHLSSHLNKLKLLSLDGCNLKKLDDDLFDDLTSLEQLSLRNNPFTEVPKALQDVPSLIWLDFSSTHINVEFANLTHLSSNLLDTNNLVMLKLGGNEWNCICDMVWIFDAGVQLDQGSKIPITSSRSSDGSSTIQMCSAECTSRTFIGFFERSGVLSRTVAYQSTDSIAIRIVIGILNRHTLLLHCNELSYSKYFLST